MFYVDYGNTELVDERNIRSMEHKFLHVPFQALECFLPLDPTDGNTWTEDAKYDTFCYSETDLAIALYAGDIFRYIICWRHI